MKKQYNNIIKKLYPYLFSDTLPFDARVLNMLCFTGFVATALSMVGHLVEGSAWQIWALKVFMLVSIAILFWSVNKYKLFKQGAWAILVVFTDIVFPLVFIWNGGFRSGISAYFVVTIVVIVLLSKGWIRFLMLIIHFIVLSVCYYISWYRPDIIIDLSDSQQLIDSIITFLIAGALIGLVIVIMQGMYLIEQRRAEQASRAKGDFLAQMSHEMRTPLIEIIGMSTIAKTQLIRNGSRTASKRSGWRRNTCSASSTIYSICQRSKRVCWRSTTAILIFMT
jgi:signal transduction histidine kinase